MHEAHDKSVEQAGSVSMPSSSMSSSIPPASMLSTQLLLLGGMSLRAKGMLVLVLFLAYTLAAGFILGLERNTLYSDIQRLEELNAEEAAQFSLNMLVTRAILVVNDNYYSANLKTPLGREAAARSISVQVEAVLIGLGRVSNTYPELFDSIVALQTNLGNLTDLPRPLDLAGVAAVRDNLHKLVFELDQVTKKIRQRKETQLAQYRATFDRLSLAWSVPAGIGILFLGSLTMFFVTRLAGDVRRVQDRALAIVEGYRAQPLDITRYDELGSLMVAINKMQFALRQHEMQIELIRQQRFHKDKMAAVGSLAAVVAHEINNPLSAIMGAAQAMLDSDEAGVNKDAVKVSYAHMILQQARRVMNITRQISEFATAPASEPALLDLNTLIRSTARFMSFDRRFGNIEMEFNLDPQLPAVRAVGDHITQVVLNLLVNAADATEGRVEPKPYIIISTQHQDSYAVIKVADNGAGMDAVTLHHVFDEFFTTKLPGKGSGIGLTISRSLIESDGGDIAIHSEQDVGTIVTVRLPLATDNQE